GVMHLPGTWLDAAHVEPLREQMNPGKRRPTAVRPILALHLGKDKGVACVSRHTAQATFDPGVRRISVASGGQRGGSPVRGSGKARVRVRIRPNAGRRGAERATPACARKRLAIAQDGSKYQVAALSESPCQEERSCRRADCRSSRRRSRAPNGAWSLSLLEE